MPTTVLVVDDHAVVREGLSAVLVDEPDFRVVGEAASGEEALALVERLRPDVVLLDERLPATSGRDVCAVIAKRFPAVRVILAMTFLDRSGIHAATAAGASGVLLKDSEPSTIRAAVRTVAEGRTFVDDRARRQAASARSGRPFGLTPRELDVVALLPRGLTNARIAAELNVSEDTVKTHLKSIRSKLGARDRTEAAAIALREGLA